MRKEIIYTLVISFLTISCKSQVIKTKSSNSTIEIIRDSILCNEKVRNRYNIPYFNFKNRKSSLVINDSISKILDPYVYFNEFEGIISENGIKKGIKKFITYSSNNCCDVRCYSFNNSESIVYFNNNKIVSFNFIIETYTAYLQEFSYYYNFNIENSKFLNTKDSFIKNEEFLAFLEKRVNSINSENLEITDFPETWYIKRSDNKIGVNFINSSPDLYYEIFISIQDLKPFLSKGLKELLIEK